MKVAQIQFAPWDKKYNFSFDNIDLKLGDLVVVETEFGKEIGKVYEFDDIDDSNIEKDIKAIIKVANKDDLKNLISEKEKEDALDFCRQTIKRHDLPMKLVDVHFSLDRNRINFAFYSSARVDFRNLVKDLTSHFKGIIRLTQIGSRDEARVCGDFGHCGRGICCQGFIKEFSPIASEMAEVQQVAHRGNERVSGMCGKLMCCLSYEYEGYMGLSKNLPPIGTEVNVDGRRGEVVGHHVLKQSVDVLFRDKESSVVIEVDINRNKKK